MVGTSSLTHPARPPSSLATPIGKGSPGIELVLTPRPSHRASWTSASSQALPPIISRRACAWPRGPLRECLSSSKGGVTFTVSQEAGRRPLWGLRTRDIEQLALGHPARKSWNRAWPSSLPHHIPRREECGPALWRQAAHRTTKEASQVNAHSSFLLSHRCLGVRFHGA